MSKPRDSSNLPGSAEPLALLQKRVDELQALHDTAVSLTSLLDSIYFRA